MSRPRGRSAAHGAAPRNRRVRPKAEAPMADAPERPSRGVRLRGATRGLRRGLERLRRPAAIGLRVALVAAVGAGAVALGRLVERHVRTSPSFALSELAVTGHVRLAEEEVLEVAGLRRGGNIFDVAPTEVVARLEAHPWVAAAEVERRLPGSYRVTLREHRAAALLALRGTFLVGEDGALFKRQEPGDPSDLPVITGVDADRFASDRAFRASLLLEVVALLHEYTAAGIAQLASLEEVHVETDDGLTLYLGADGTEVRLGHGPFRRKLERLRRVLDELGRRGAEAAYVYLDNARRPDRVTVRVREDPRDEAPAEEAPEAPAPG